MNNISFTLNEDKHTLLAVVGSSKQQDEQGKNYDDENTTSN